MPLSVKEGWNSDPVPLGPKFGSVNHDPHTRTGQVICFLGI